jgi:PDDEXK-like uncharacterized protein DUF3799
MTTAPDRAAEYHADPELRLTSTRARLLHHRTPAHAKWAADHPDQPGTSAMALGTAVHQILLRDDRIVVGDFDSFRTKDAREWRDSAYAIGRVPVLASMWDEAREIAGCINGAVLESTVEPTPFTQGTAEHVIRFEDNGAKCRSMLDWLRDDLTIINDLKTTSDASPRKFERHIFNMGYDIQAAFYVRAVEAAYGVTPKYQWVVAETTPPYPVTIVELSEPDMNAARVKVDAAIAVWNDCLAKDEWPAYGKDVFTAWSPAWARAESESDLSDVDLAEVPF